MRRIKTIKDIVDWGMCVGCGACYSFCHYDGAVRLINVESVGIRPCFKVDMCKNCNNCLSICPGYNIDAGYISFDQHKKRVPNNLIGETIEIWEGFASDQNIRYNASSGGVLTALALYCIEKENMEFVLHTGMDPYKPWLNRTTISREKSELMFNAGSRYAPSSPCDMLNVIEKADRPCVFIGKPCDVAAVNMTRKSRPQLDRKLGLVLSFFCAGTPCTKATIDLLGQMEIEKNKVKTLRYRGEGWPGKFRVSCDGKHIEKQLPYIESWRQLAKQRPFRCHLCPDGLGQLADISTGDAWNKYDENTDSKGLSHVLVRSGRGKNILKKAFSDGYICLEKSNPKEVIEAQGLVRRKQLVFGRILAMRLFVIPTTKFEHFNLLNAWKTISVTERIRSIAGTIKRILRRKLWRPKDLFVKNDS